MRLKMKERIKKMLMRKVYFLKRELSYIFWFYYIRMYEFVSLKFLNYFLKIIIL